jgi:hypothetical protein
MKKRSERTKKKQEDEEDPAFRKSDWKKTNEE